MALAPPTGVKRRKLTADDEDFYPSSDGKPMAETAKHFRQMVYNVEALDAHFAAVPDILVAGNNFLYWEKGNRKAAISPDCYVVIGADKRLRDTYRVWAEGGIKPAFVLEITSKKTRREDIYKKRPIYEQILQVPEYFQFDPTSDYLKPPLQGLRLESGRYAPIPLVNNRLHSEQLGLDLVWEGELLRFYDPVKGEWLLSSEEQRQRAEAEAARAEFATQRALREAERADVEAQRAEVEAQARAEEKRRADAAEAEIARLRAELDALRKQAENE